MILLYGGGEMISAEMTDNIIFSGLYQESPNKSKEQQIRYGSDIQCNYI